MYNFNDSAYKGGFRRFSEMPTNLRDSFFKNEAIERTAKSTVPLNSNPDGHVKCKPIERIRETHKERPKSHDEIIEECKLSLDELLRASKWTSNGNSYTASEAPVYKQHVMSTSDHDYCSLNDFFSDNSNASEKRNSINMGLSSFNNLIAPHAKQQQQQNLNKLSDISSNSGDSKPYNVAPNIFKSSIQLKLQQNEKNQSKSGK